MAQPNQPSRIRDIPESALTQPQRAAIAALVGGRGRIPTPYKVWLASPIMMQHMERLGTYLITESSLTPRERELAILVVAHHWHGAYVFAAHTRAGREVGLPDAVIDAIAQGRAPDLVDPRERAVVAIAATAEAIEPASDEVFAAAVAALSEAGLAELIVFLGYYSSVAIAMKLFRAPLAGRAAS
jgi:4-carboxymuconolactone decarboxylase